MQHQHSYRIMHPITRLIVGGAQINTIDTCAELDRQMYACTIIAGTQTGPEGELFTEARRRAVRLIELPELVREVSPLNDLRALQKLIRCFRRERPHIVHTHSSKAGILGRWAARCAHVPVSIHTVHGWGHHEYQHPLKKRLFIRLERLCAPLTDTLIVVSDRNRDKGLADRIGRPDQYITIHSCIDVDTFADCSIDRALIRARLGLRPDSLVVGTVGRFSAQKNPADFVRAAAHIKRHVPQAQFLFVGDGPLRSGIERMLAETGLGSDMVLAGLRTDVAAMLRCMDVFLLTSLWEGLPRVIPEAMAAGLPVVANAVDGVCEVLEDGVSGFRTQPGDIDTTAGRVIELLRNGALRARMGAAGQVTARQAFSRETMISQIDALYRSLLSSKGVASA